MLLNRGSIELSLIMFSAAKQFISLNDIPSKHSIIDTFQWATIKKAQTRCRAWAIKNIKGYRLFQLP